jgi:hypothetical protein
MSITSQELEELCQFFASEFKMSLETLLEKKSSFVEKLRQKKANEPVTLSLAILQKCKKVELQAMCTERSLKLSGTKEELIDRLLNRSPSQKEDKPKKEKEDKPKKEKEDNKPKKSSPAKAKPVKSVLNSIKQKEPFVIVKNSFGNFENLATRYVVKDETIIGKQKDDGTIAQLVDLDIEYCKQYHLKYKLPVNLDVVMRTKGDESESDLEIEKESESESSSDESDFDVSE